MIHTPYLRFIQSIRKVIVLSFGLALSCKQTTHHEVSHLFSERSSQETGIDFVNKLPYNHMMNNMVYDYYYNGGGVAAGDINNDGLTDLFFTANLLPDKLYLNKGNLQFEDITSQAGIRHNKSWSTGVTMADVNADGWLDIYVCKSGRLSSEKRANQLFINQKDGTFKEQAALFGLNSSHYSTQAAFLDFDRDGDLDVYLLNHPIEKTIVKDLQETRNTTHSLGADQLLENRDGKFVDVSIKAGILGNPLSFGLGIAVGDLNGDHWPDLFVTNDYSEPDYLYYNQQNGTFKETIKDKTGKISNFSMGNDIADFNNDGLLDMVTAEMSPEDNYSIKTSMSGMNPEQFNRLVANGMHHQYMYNTLQLNAGGGHFSEISQLANISNTGWSWAALLADFDLDGHKDLFITNGYKRDNSNNDFKIWYKKRLKQFESSNTGDTVAFMSEVIQQIPEVFIPNYIFKNNGNLQFESKTDDWGMSRNTFSSGAAYVDLDNDGDLEIVVNNLDDSALIYENKGDEMATQNYLGIQLNGAAANPFGVGAKVYLYAKGTLQYQENYPSRGYQSASSANLIFGLDAATHVDSLRIEWPDGKQSISYYIEGNQTIQANHTQAVERQPEMKILLTSNSEETGPPTPIFQDMTAAMTVEHLHVENDYDDFQKESLLPHKLSEFGPALATGDINGDGRDDLYVGGAKGKVPSLYIQKANGSFQAASNNFWTGESKYEDLDALFFDADQDNDLDLYVVSGGNEFQSDDLELQDRLYLNDGRGNFTRSNRLPQFLISGSKVHASDFDRDGDLDLFVAGRLLPGQYPTPASSKILRNEQGKFIDITLEACPVLENIGMVTDAIWTDFNQDKQPDLIVVGEWMAPRCLQQQNGKWIEITPEDLTNKVGWWFSIAQGDYDNDGDMDYILGNLGLNYKYKASENAPFNIYTKDFDDSGNLDIVLGYYNNGEEFPLRGRQCSSNQMPFIKEKFPTYHDFGSATIVDVYGKTSLSESIHYSATTFASSYMENLGNGDFEIHQLPIEAQFSSVNDIIVEDFNQDGHLDAVIVGNLYQSEVETPRNDASYGLYLEGDGTGNFRPKPTIASGLFVKGDTKVAKTLRIGQQQTIVVGKNQDYIQLIGW